MSLTGRIGGKLLLSDAKPFLLQFFRLLISALHVCGGGGVYLGSILTNIPNVRSQLKAKQVERDRRSCREPCTA